MLKVTGVAAALAAVLLLTLTGCAQAANNASDDTAQRNSTSSEASSESPEPLASESAAAEADEASSADGEFVAYVRGELLPDTGIGDASDEQLVDAALKACELLLAGTDSESIRLVEGEQPAASGYYMDSAAIIDGARRFYCPETIH